MVSPTRQGYRDTGSREVVASNAAPVAVDAKQLRGVWPTWPSRPLGCAAKMLLAAEIVGLYMSTHAWRVADSWLAEQLDAAQSPNPSEEFLSGQDTAEAVRLGGAVARTLDLPASLPTRRV